ncbi:primase C-terminal domain-containing protein [Ferroacidibacillus organovorans]|uniref:Primase C-terminal 1 domain-containing protein n=1 Tax=Ferroacidibacillus organovorans TaxID=1765683 RepID=A0A1V4ESV0_9BACL|nr:primase C-terminal domain-containing protein [Ferroacidibacillus organovorans]OPG15997.1 hypothetical protein B2M26_08880 [Ferroacidibacillus organovorans]
MSAISLVTENRVKIVLKNDAVLEFAHAKDRRSTEWPTIEAHLSQLYTRLARVIRTPETTTEFDAMDKQQQDGLKDVGGYIPAILKGSRRISGAVEARTAIVLDADTLPSDGHLKLWQDWLNSFGYNALIHTTRKHRPESPRARLVIPTDRPMALDEYHYICGFIYCVLNEEENSIFDHTTLQAERFMYWPSASTDQEFWYKINDAELLHVDHFMSGDPDWRNSDWMQQLNSIKPRVDQTQFTRERFGDGERTATFTRLTGTLLAHGIDADVTWQLMDAFNQVFFNPPFGYQKFEHDFRGIWKREEAKRNGRTN